MQLKSIQHTLHLNHIDKKDKISSKTTSYLLFEHITLAPNKINNSKTTRSSLNPYYKHHNTHNQL